LKNGTSAKPKGTKTNARPRKKKTNKQQEKKIERKFHLDWNIFDENFELTFEMVWLEVELNRVFAFE